MISILIYDKVETELRAICKEIRNQAAYLSDELWDIIVMKKDFGEIEAPWDVNGASLLDMACIDVTEKGALLGVERLRMEFQELHLLLIADTSLSPMDYIKPGIKAASLLLRPCSREDICRVVKEFVESYMEYFHSDKEKSSYVIDTREGKIHIPYHKIYYFEAREKKLYIQTDSEEYGFYGIMDKLEEVLPKQFQRCHRSFIVNTYKIDRLILAKNRIQLMDGWEIPVSRSYRNLFKDLGRNQSGD